MRQVAEATKIWAEIRKIIDIDGIISGHETEITIHLDFTENTVFIDSHIPVLKPKEENKK